MRKVLLVIFLGIALGAAGQLSLRERAEAGDPEAMNYLGYSLISGVDSTTVDLAEGLKWLSRAAAAGSLKAASNLGWLLIDGSAVEQDLEKGVSWIRKAAEGGLPVAQSILGDLYLEGKGLDKDSVAADSLYRQAFERGVRDAGYKLYEMNGKRYAALPADQMVEEGLYFYLKGLPSEGVKLFYMAADKGNSRAMALLGDAYTRGMGVPYDYDLSLSYYTKAAQGGDPSAQFVMGELLDIFPDALNKLDPEEFPDLPKEGASYWYDKAAQAGITDADSAYRLLLGSPIRN